MPIDPQVQAFLGQSDEAGALPVERLTPELAREMLMRTRELAGSARACPGGDGAVRRTDRLTVARINEVAQQ